MDVPVDDVHPLKEEPDCYACNDRGCLSCCTHEECMTARYGPSTGSVELTEAPY